MITAEDIQAHLDGLAKPPGSLGTLERLAGRLAEVQGSLKPVSKPRRLMIFAGDHGVVANGVGIWPSEVTGAMIGLIANGRAASSALAKSSGTDIDLIDVGSKIATAPKSALYRDERVGRGTDSLAQGSAMTADQFWKAWMVGDDAVKRAKAEGVRVIGLGEIGIGNTTPAACLIALIAGADPSLVVGPGAGATKASLAKKNKVVATAVQRVSVQFDDEPVAAIAAVAGFEIVAMAGAIATAAQSDITVVLDGVVTAAAALVALVVDPAALETAIASHLGAEPAHKIALEKLGLEPFLDWQMRLGEGTGALLLMPMLDAAAALLSDVATLKEVAG